MTGSLVSLRRIAAVSVAITLFAAPIASAQSPEAAPPMAAPATQALLSPAAFARLIQPPPADGASAPDVIAPPRMDLRHIALAATTGEAPRLKLATPSKHWVGRHKVLTGVLIGVGAIFAGYGLWVYAGCGGNDCG